MFVSEKAYAKVNLWLGVSGLRGDGYHDIVTVMHSVSLADDIMLRADADPCGFSCILEADGAYEVPEGDDNIAVKAARAFCEKTGIGAAVTIRLVKNIPTCAGLAGGSSDAAAVLRAINKRFSEPLSVSELEELAIGLGSDVPFCLHGGTALCLGRGEKMTRLGCPDLDFVICPSPERVSTGTAYAKLDEKWLSCGYPDTASCNELIVSLSAGAAECGRRLYNIFQDVVIPLCPVSGENISRLRSLGACGAVMSGSGSAVYGIFETRRKADAAAEKIPGAVCVSSVGESIGYD